MSFVLPHIKPLPLNTILHALPGIFVSFLTLTACTRTAQPLAQQPWLAAEPHPLITPTENSPSLTPSRTPFLPATRIPGSPILTPTPDAPHAMPTPIKFPDQHMVQAGETLGSIAMLYDIPIDLLIKVNQLTNPDALYVGQVLSIPVATPGAPGPAFKIIPDSELVYGPASAYFDIQDFISQFHGYLASYHEKVDEQLLNGAEIVQRVAQDYSVNPRLLLAILEYQSGWVTQSVPDELEYPIKWVDAWHNGLYRQLTWAADQLNFGFYAWQANAVSRWTLPDGNIVPIDATINAGTAGVQYFFSRLLDRQTWQATLSPTGFFTTYLVLFGYPFDLAIEPLVPPNLVQPEFQLPFESGVPWYFTGGPHGGWDNGSAWAALDFTPPGAVASCGVSPSWVTAVADGLIVRSANGAVIQDLDGDGFEQTGWAVLYMHTAVQNRVNAGTYIHVGDRIGHPSCEGGLANATHLHIARRYNGVWISANGPMPFQLGNWKASGTGTMYDGYLQSKNQTLEACECRKATNTIQH